MNLVLGLLLPQGGGNLGSRKVYATWDSTAKQPNAMLSNDKLTLTQDGYTSGQTRATISKTAGKWYWEITLSAEASGNIGIANANSALSVIVGQDTNSAGWQGNGAFLYNVNVNGAQPLSGSLSGKTVGIALDATNRTFSFYYNGVKLAALGDYAYTAYLGTGAICPVATAYTPDATTANFGAAPFAWPVPAGYNSGLYLE